MRFSAIAMAVTWGRSKAYPGYVLTEVVRLSPIPGF